ncbi:MAG TPA: regulator SirB [Gammaproteobacteria bacterium]|nr:regulator SirB [Gammaproteobacteria bacterium]
MMEAVKWLHVTCVLLSGAGFFTRGILLWRDSPWLQARLVKVLPHVVDTLLLASAIVLASQWGWAALGIPWLQAKIIALLVYIGLGMVALHAGFSKKLRLLAWNIAMLVFVYIIAVAITKRPWLLA